MSNCLQQERDAMPEANSIPTPSNLIQTQKYFLHSTRLSYSPSLSPCGGRGEGGGGNCQGIKCVRIGWTIPGPCACGPDAWRRTGVPTPHSAGWSSPAPRLLAARRCTPQATAAVGSAAPPPGESFEAYHPSSIGVICVMIAWRLRAVKPFL